MAIGDGAAGDATGVAAPGVAATGVPAAARTRPRLRARAAYPVNRAAGAAAATSGVIPEPSINRPDGVSHCANVIRTLEPSGKSWTRCTDPLPNALLADDRRPVIVLQCAGDDLGCAGGATVDQHDHRERHRLPAVADDRDSCLVARLRRIVFDEGRAGTFGHEPADHFLGRTYQPAAIVAEIEHDAGHAVLLEPIKYRIKLLYRR